MRKALFFALAAIAMLTVACGGGFDRSKMEKALDSLSNTAKPLEGDHSIYGLACEGCNDSVVYLLLEDGSDPIKFDIISAFKKKHVFGDMAIGSNIAVVPNAKDSTIADYVINLDELKGTWCYRVMPQLRVSEEATEADKARMMSELTDSIKELYFIPREYGFTLKRQYVMDNVGYVANATEEDSPVMYPQRSFYFAWHLLNGKLVLSRYDGVHLEDMRALSQKNAKTVNDTIDILFLSNDSLTLSSDGVSRTYYRLANAKDANKLANQKAQEVKEATEKEMIEGKR